jgi:hypothetical protein
MHEFNGDSLGSGNKLADFHFWGTLLVFSDMLKISVTIVANSIANDFQNQYGRLCGPDKERF